MPLENAGRPCSKNKNSGVREMSSPLALWLGGASSCEQRGWDRPPLRSRAPVRQGGGGGPPGHLRLALQQPLETRVAPQWGEGGVDLEPAGREVVGDLEQRLE